MSNSFYEKNKYLLLGASALTVGAAIWFLTQDGEEAFVIDPKTHTIERLRLIVDEICIECATLYCQKLRLIREQKKDGKFEGEISIAVLVDK